MTKTPETAKLLRSLREGSGKSLRQTANELGVAPSYLSRLERGERSINKEFGKKVAGYYGIESELVDLNEGRIPADILSILNEHPEVLEELRDRFNTTMPIEDGA
jgi:transcriptional regulator with XRE-family HTH domain